jgi:hypothetical protein
MLTASIVTPMSSALAVAEAQPSPAPSAPFATDDRGFVDSQAHCDATQIAVAVGRTQRSLVAICTDPHGQYEYRGVRIGDGAALKVAAETTPGRGFLAHNDDFTYTVSPTELVVSTDIEVIRREPMIEYKEPRSYAAESPASH